MLSSDIAKNVIYRSIKEIYYKKLSETQKNTLDDDEIIKLVDHIYKNKKYDIENEIRMEIKNKLVGDKYPGDQYVDDLIRDIMEDENITKIRVKTEIKLYQKNKERQLKYQ